MSDLEWESIRDENRAKEGTQKIIDSSRDNNRRRKIEGGDKPKTEIDQMIAAVRAMGIGGANRREEHWNK